MSAPRLYAAEVAGDLAAGREVALHDAAAHHAAKVLRLRTGDAVTLFTGEGGEFAATITRIDRRGVAVRVERFVAVERESALATTLVQAVAASDAMEYAVRKAVELGAAAVQPVIATRSAPLPAGARGEQRRERWRSIAIAACEQCGRNRVPDVGAPVALAAWLAARDAGAPGIALVLDGAVALSKVATPTRTLDVVVGPEGGFTSDEIAATTRAGLVAVTLGPRILRTETAGPAALAAINALWGDFR